MASVSGSDMTPALGELIPQEIQCQQVPADLRHLPFVRDRFVAYLDQAGVSKQDRDMLVLGFTEALANAIKHGCDLNSQQTIQVEWWSEPGMVHLAFGHEGTGPVEKLARNPHLPEDPLASGGRGLFLIHQIFDECRHWRTDGRYRLELSKRLASLAEPPPMTDEVADLLEELSNMYESLATFHRMGTALIEFERAGDFMSEGLEKISGMHTRETPGRVEICLSGEVLPSVQDELGLIEGITPEADTIPFVRQLMKNGDSFFWNDRSAVEQSPELSGYGSGCCFPIVAGGVTLGCLLTAKESEGESFSGGELSNLRTFSDLFGIALANANLQTIRQRELRTRRELELAAEIQKTLLAQNTPPVSPDWKLYLRHHAAREVAGDYLEARLDARGNLLMTVIDVMGKGVSAAMLATIYRTGFLLNLEQEKPLEEIVRTLNQVLCSQLHEITMFVTGGLVRVSKDLDRIEIVNAGHCPILVRDQSGAVSQVEASGPPMGLFEDSEYSVQAFSPEQCEGVFIVTDGMFEWRENGHWWGWENLIKEVNEGGFDDPAGLWEHIQELIKRHRNRNENLDDQTMLCWTRNTNK